MHYEETCSSAPNALSWSACAATKRSRISAARCAIQPQCCSTPALPARTFCSSSAPANGTSLATVPAYQLACPSRQHAPPGVSSDCCFSSCCIAGTAGMTWCETGLKHLSKLKSPCDMHAMPAAARFQTSLTLTKLLQAYRGMKPVMTRRHSLCFIDPKCGSILPGKSASAQSQLHGCYGWLRCCWCTIHASAHSKLQLRQELFVHGVVGLMGRPAASIFLWRTVCAAPHAASGHAQRLHQQRQLGACRKP